MYDGKISSRIPLLVKMPRQHQAAVHDESLPATIIRELILDLLAGRISDSLQLRLWLTARGG